MPRPASRPLIAYLVICLCVTNYSAPLTARASAPAERPLLPEPIATEVAQLVEQIDADRMAFLRGESDALGDSIVDARTVLDLRMTHQRGWTDPSGGEAEWYEVADARRDLSDLKIIASLSLNDRRRLAEAWDYSNLERAFGEGRLADAQALAESQREIFTEFFGKDHPRALLAVNDIGVTLAAQGKGGSEPYYRDALEGYRRVLGDEHPKTLESIYNLGSILYAKGAYGEAEQFVREAMDGTRRIRGNDHFETLRTINNMGALLQGRGKLTDAEPLYREAMDGSRRLLGDDHPDTIIAINNMGALLQAQGKLADAEPLFREALERRQRIRGNDHPDTLSSFNWMGNLLHRRGRYAEAEPHLREAMEGYRRVLGEDHPFTLSSVSGVGSLLGWQGKYAEAESYLRDALAGCERALGPDHPSTFGSMSRLASLLVARDKADDAERYAQSALAGRQRVLGDDHPSTLRAMFDMGSVLKAQDRVDEAESLWNDALAGYRRVLGDLHPETLHCLHALGDLCVGESRLDDAERFYQEALAGRRSVLGDDHSETIRSIHATAVLHQRQNRLDDAATHFREALTRAQRLRGTATGGERGRAAMSGRLDIRHIAASLAQLLAQQDQDAEAWTIAEQGRGRALLDLLARGEEDLEAAIDNPAAIQRARSRETRVRANVNTAEARLAAMERERAHIAADEFIPPAQRETQLSEFDDALESQHDLILDTRRELNEATALVYLALHDVMPDTQSLPFEQIQSRLSPGDVMLGYTWAPDRVMVSTATASSVEHAFIASTVKEVDSLDARVHETREAMARRPREGSAPLDHAAVLDALIPPALRAQVAAAERVIVLPDGPLSGLPLEALVTTQADAPLNDSRQQVVYATSATVYLNRRATAATARKPADLTLLALGDPIFTRDHSASDPDAIVAGNATRGMDDRIARASLLDVVRVHGGTLPRLPGTRVEVERLGELVGEEAMILVGEDATLNGLETSVRGVRYLHIATHGLIGTQERPYDASLALTPPVTPDVRDIGFLTLDHLIREWRGALASCDLVTLSACDTQRGVRQGDALMSLPWGFYYAGAPTVVASLWQIDDEATALLMSRFYENLLGSHDDERTIRGETFGRDEPMSKADALQEAKRWLRTYEVQGRGVGRGPVIARGGRAEVRHPYEHPYYWAAFVLIGDPG